MNAFLCWSALDACSECHEADSSSIFALPSEHPSYQIAADISFHVVQGRTSSSWHWDTCSTNAGIANCERSSATPLTPDTDATLMMPMSALYCELGFTLDRHS